MKKLVNCCDECGKLGEHLTLTLTAGKALCNSCVDKWKYERRIAIREQNKQIAPQLSSCDKCKHTGIIHRSIYACGPGYYDEPDPTIYCTCPRGKALNPDTNYIVVEQ